MAVAGRTRIIASMPRVDGNCAAEKGQDGLDWSQAGSTIMPVQKQAGKEQEQQKIKVLLPKFDNDKQFYCQTPPAAR